MIQDILETARVIMREQGAAALTMQGLARRLEMRAPSLYNYFSGLMDIYDALFRLGFTLWEEHIKSYPLDAQTWQDEIRLAMEGLHGFCHAKPRSVPASVSSGPFPGLCQAQPACNSVFAPWRAGYAHAHRGALSASLDTAICPQNRRPIWSSP